VASYEGSDLTVCANPEVDPRLVAARCAEEAIDNVAGWYFWYGIPVRAHRLYFADMAAGATRTECRHGSVVYLSGGPSNWELDFDAGATNSTISVSDSGARGSADAHGTIGLNFPYDYESCATTGCPLQIVGLRGNVDDFTVRGCGPIGVICDTGEVTATTVTLHGRVQATWFSGGGFTIPAYALEVQLNFTVDGQTGSTVVSNHTDSMGTFDPVTGFLDITGNFSQGGTAVELHLHAGAVNFPPTAVIDSPSTVECLGELATPVPMSMEGSTDRDGNLAEYEWVIGENTVSTDMAPSISLPLGTSRVQGYAIDEGGSMDGTFVDVSVVDTAAPVIDGPSSVALDACSSTSLFDVVTFSAADACFDVLTTTIRVTSVNGASVDLAWGAWVNTVSGSLAGTVTSADDAGNMASFNFELARVQGAACCPSGLEQVVGTDDNDVLASLNHAQCYVGQAGDDTIQSGNSGDVILCGAGNDSCVGGNGEDLIVGDLGNDSLDGANGKDTIHGGPGDDTILGGNGDDEIIPGTGRDHVNAGNGSDRIVIRSTCDIRAGEVIEGGNGRDTLVSPVSLEQLVAMGVSVSGIEVVVVEVTANQECVQ
jgi:hypothetical protein